MRALVTGVNGLVGARVAELLNANGHEVTGISRGERRISGRTRYRSCELTSAAEVEAACAEFKPDLVIHPASMTEVDRCEKEPALAWEANVVATANVARASHHAGAHLVHVSTDYVFDGDAGPYAEDAVPNPRGVYATTKHVAEQAVRVLAPGAAIARTAVVYGYPPSAARTNFGVWLVSTLEKGEPVKLFEDQFVSPTLADSVAAMLVELGERRLGGIWHTCGGEVVSRVQFGRIACEVFGFDPKLLIPTRLADLKLAAPRPLRTGLQVQKTHAELKAKPLSVRESLERFRAAYGAGKR